MSNRPRRSRIPQLVIVLVCAMVLGVLATRDRDHASSPVATRETPFGARWVIRVTPVPTETMTWLSTSTPSTAQTAPTSATHLAMPTRSMPTPTPPPRKDHFWLSRPIASSGIDSVARTYPYASRLDGTYPVHHGVEFVNPTGTEILAPIAGTIMVAGDDAKHVYGARDDYYGLLVIIKADARLYGQPVFVLCGHMSEVLCQVGQRVQAGDVIGLVGMTGYAEGPHVHMEVRVGANDYGRTVNPELWLQPLSDTGTLAGVLLTSDGQPIPEARLVLYADADPNKPIRYVTTYPERLVNPDPAWGENFATGDLGPGEYLIQLYWANHLYQAYATVISGETTWITIRT